MDAESADQRLRDIYWLERAAEDLYRIVSQLEETNPEKAEQLYRAVHDTATNLAYFPQLGRVGRVKGTREAVVPGAPYILPYRDVAADNRIEILAVLHARQAWPTSFNQPRPDTRETPPPEPPGAEGTN